MRYLIINADDFGLSPGINRGIAQAHERGIVTSASLMVRWPAAVEAAAYGREHRDISIGLHFDFGEWIYREENWETLYEVVPATDESQIRAEAARQLDTFRSLLEHEPTHLDSHQHAHLTEPMRSVLVMIASDLNVPLRGCGAHVQYNGSFYGQLENGAPHPHAISVEGLLEVIGALPPGITELACHPGLPDGLASMYSDERAQEITTLCDARVRKALAQSGIELCSFRDVGGAERLRGYRGEPPATLTVPTDESARVARSFAQTSRMILPSTCGDRPAPTPANPARAKTTG